MGLLVKCTALIALLGVSCTRASPAPAPEPVITAPAILPRVALQTLGWYSTVTGGQAQYVPWIFDADTSTYTSSGSFFRRCSVSSTCPLYTSCSSGFMVASGTSSFCGMSGLPGSSSLSYCSHHSLLPSLNAASGGQSWLWCDTAPLTGNTFYVRQPAQPTPTPLTNSARTTGTGTDSSSTMNRFTSPTRSTSTAASSTAATSESNTRRKAYAAIAGGVLGGVAVIGAIGFAVIFMMRRKKNKRIAAASAYQAAPLINTQQAYPQNSGYPSQADFYADTTYQGNENKPQMQPGYMPQAYPAGPYDPHRSLEYPHGLPPQELANTVVYPPQELPAPRSSEK